jgi:branched-chain amino acid transport system ATP-binding protein
LATEALAVSDIDAFYGDSHVLHGVSFSLQPGRLLGLLGRNGAGKTTCMSTIMGFLKPRHGTIALFGEPVTSLPADTIARKGICLVPQGRRMFRTLTVRENLMVAAQPANKRTERWSIGRIGWLRSWLKEEQAPPSRSSPGTERPNAPAGSSENGDDRSWSIDRVFQLFPRLKERHAQVAGSLSGGEQQMLAIGRALMGNPRVLLMDEPSEGLAPQLVAEVGRTIARLKAAGLSIVLVEQNIKLTLDLADDVVIINTGRIVFEGSADQVRLDDAMVSQHLGVF